MSIVYSIYRASSAESSTMETPTHTPPAMSCRRKNPLATSRSNTNFSFTICFGIVIVAWFGLLLYVLIKGDKQNVTGNGLNQAATLLPEHLNKLNVAIHRLNAYIKLRPFMLKIYDVLFASTLMMLFNLAVRWLPRVFTSAGVLYVCFSVGDHLASIIRQHENPVSAAAEAENISGVVISIIFLVTALICLHGVSEKSIANINELGFRYIFSSRGIFFFAYCAVIVYQLLIVPFALAMSLTKADGYTRFILLLGGIYLSNVLMSFCNMVIAGSVATWHWSKREAQFPKNVQTSWLKKVCRYHSGSIFLSATIILPILLAAYTACKHSFQTTEKSVRGRVLEFICKIFLVINIKEVAEIQVAVHGYDYSTAVQKSLATMMKDFRFSVAFIKILHGIIEFGFIIAFTVSYLLCSLIWKMYVIPEDGQNSLLQGYATHFLSEINVLFVMIACVPIMIMAYSSALTTYFCKLQENEDVNVIIETTQL